MNNTGVTREELLKFILRNMASIGVGAIIGGIAKIAMLANPVNILIKVCMMVAVIVIGHAAGDATAAHTDQVYEGYVKSLENLMPSLQGNR